MFSTDLLIRDLNFIDLSTDHVHTPRPNLVYLSVSNSLFNRKRKWCRLKFMENSDTMFSTDLLISDLNFIDLSTDHVHTPRPNLVYLSI